MYLLSHLPHICYFSMLIRLINGYLLFAANLDDFHAIAKKLVPETLGETLARIAAKPYLRDKQDDSDFDNSEELSSDNDNNDSLPPIRGKKEKYPPIKGKENQNPKETFDISQNTKVDFDELVERVKKRLTTELKQSYLSELRKELSKSLNEERKHNNDKLLKVDDYNKNLVRHSKKQRIKNVNKQDNLEEKAKYVKDRFNFEEMSPFADTPDYKEDIFNKHKVKQVIKTIKPAIDADDNEDATTLPSKYSNPAKKGNNNVNTALKNREPSLNKNVAKEIEMITDPNGSYEKIDLTQNDSYEDYVTPAKENIYSSSENKQSYNKDENKQKYNIPNNKRYKIETNSHYHKNFDNNHATVKTKLILNKNARESEKSIKSPNNYDKYTEKNVESKEIKAKTENLWYGSDEKNSFNTVVKAQMSKKPKFGTKIPTRHTFRMATPNFIANIPVIVEKYNFDEPIPEKDRERESLKYIGNPPASINKKVRLL